MTSESNPQQRIEDIARRLLDARRTQTRVSLADLLPADAAEAYAVQDLVAQSLGPIGGWKVGAKGPDGEPTCAPLAAAGIVATPARLADGAWRSRGIETELAVRFDADLPERETPYTRDEVLAAIGALLPAIEVVETRLVEFPKAQPLAMLADMGAHGALVTGVPIAFTPALLDSAGLHARQWFDDKEVVNKAGGNPAGDLGRLLTWLANHCAARGLGLTTGQIVTTGSCTGMLFAPAGAKARGAVAGLGECAVTFGGGAT
jgi:2-keto-4-pentenoate hydratase